MLPYPPGVGWGEGRPGKRWWFRKNRTSISHGATCHSVPVMWYACVRKWIKSEMHAFRLYGIVLFVYNIKNINQFDIRLSGPLAKRTGRTRFQITLERIMNDSATTLKSLENRMK